MRQVDHRLTARLKRQDGARIVASGYVGVYMANISTGYAINACWQDS